MADLRIETKILLVRKGLDKIGLLPTLAKQLSEKTGRRVSQSTLSMALSGYRSGEAYQRVLQDLHDMLQENSDESSAPLGCETIHA